MVWHGMEHQETVGNHNNINAKSNQQQTTKRPNAPLKCFLIWSTLLIMVLCLGCRVGWLMTCFLGSVVLHLLFETGK